MELLKRSKRSNRYKIPIRVLLKVNETFGIDAKELSKMVAKSALITHPRGNRRYHEWLFNIQHGELLDVMRLEEVAIVENALMPQKETKSIEYRTKPVGGGATYGQGVTISDGGKQYRFNIKDRDKINPSYRKSAAYAPTQKPEVSLAANPYKMKCPVCGGGGTELVYSECPYCEGNGCDKCDGTGEVLDEIPCQACKA